MGHLPVRAAARQPDPIEPELGELVAGALELAPICTCGNRTARGHGGLSCDEVLARRAAIERAAVWTARRELLADVAVPVGAVLLGVLGLVTVLVALAYRLGLLG